MNKHLPTARGAALADLALRLSAVAKRRGLLALPRPARAVPKPVQRPLPR